MSKNTHLIFGLKASYENRGNCYEQKYDDNRSILFLTGYSARRNCSGLFAWYRLPGEFVHAEFMFRDSNKYADTHGWGWARRVGLEQQPFEEGASVCINCHTPVKGRNWVFTDPAELPK